jgi:hypothetical protein
MKACVQWVLALAFIALFSCRGYAGVTRSIQATDDRRVEVTVHWAFAEPFDACLMLNEQLPTGWTFDAVASADTDVHARIDADRFTMAVGVFQPLPLNGALSYWLRPDDPNEPDTLDFAGQGRSMRGVQRLNLPLLQGEHTFAWSPPAPPAGPNAQLALRVTRIQLTPPDAGGEPDASGFGPMAQPLAESGLRMGFVVETLDPDDPEADPAPLTLLTAGTDAAYRLVIEYRPSLTEGPEWVGIYTGAPMTQLESQGEIILPPGHQPGFYRLRLDLLEGEGHD